MTMVCAASSSDEVLLPTRAGVWTAAAAYHALGRSTSIPVLTLGTAPHAGDPRNIRAAARRGAMRIPRRWTQPTRVRPLTVRR